MADLSRARSCRSCGCSHEPHTPRTRSCTVCTRFSSLRSNAGKTRRDGASPGLGFGLDEFAAWFSAQDRRCAYCRIPESLIEELGLRTQVGLPLQRLGVDRLDGRVGYEIGNIVLCCFACNKARSNTFSAEEMAEIGPAVARVWRRRLAAAGITWDRSRPTGVRSARKSRTRHRVCTGIR